MTLSFFQCNSSFFPTTFAFICVHVCLNDLSNCLFRVSIIWGFWNWHTVLTGICYKFNRTHCISICGRGSWGRIHY